MPAPAAGIVLSKKALTLSGGGLAALLVAGQALATQYVTTALEPHRLAIKEELAQLREDAEHDRLTRWATLRAILTYQIEADRYLRATLGGAHPRPPELDRAVDKLRALSE